MCVIFLTHSSPYNTHTHTLCVYGPDDEKATKRNQRINIRVCYREENKKIAVLPPSLDDVAAAAPIIAPDPPPPPNGTLPLRLVRTGRTGGWWGGGVNDRP